MSVITTLGTIQAEAEEVQYLSEQTHDVNSFVIARSVTTLNQTTFQNANPFIFGKSIETFDAADICDRQGVDWATLKNILVNLTDATAFKVGSIQREVYIVGLLNGHIVGVRTFAIET